MHFVVMVAEQRKIKGVSEVITSIGKESIKTTRTYKIVSWDKAPEFMKINPFVIEGYRPYFSYFLCIKSLFRLHNEVILSISTNK